MIAGIFHEGSGLGDQLFRYITVRTLAEEKGVEWGMQGHFKGDFFVNPPHVYLDKWQSYTKPYPWQGNGWKDWNEKIVRDENGVDIRSYDPDINFVRDNTIIDGSFEDSKYWAHNLDNINKWLAVEPLNVPDDVCVVGFRGGEYYIDSNLGLPKEYYRWNIKVMRELGVNKFEVHTDDPIMASDFFQDVFKGAEISIVENQKISHSKHSNMGFNWRSARYAKYAIIPNSAFFILPRILKHLEDPSAVTIAPRYWARRNTGVWARPACYYKQFTYI